MTAEEFRKVFFSSKYYTAQNVAQCMEAYHKHRLKSVSDEDRNKAFNEKQKELGEFAMNPKERVDFDIGWEAAINYLLTDK